MQGVVKAKAELPRSGKMRNGVISERKAVLAGKTCVQAGKAGYLRNWCGGQGGIVRVLLPYRRAPFLA